MKLINWLIKKLVNYKYKKDHFLAWSWSIDYHTDMNIISEESYLGYRRFGTKIDTIDTIDIDEEYDEQEKTYIVNLYDLKKAIAVNPYDPEKNIAGYLRYLRYNTPEFKKEKDK